MQHVPRFSDTSVLTGRSLPTCPTNHTDQLRREVCHLGLHLNSLFPFDHGKGPEMSPPIPPRMLCGKGRFQQHSDEWWTCLFFPDYMSLCMRTYIYIYTPTYIWLCISNLYLHIHHWYLHNHVFIHVYMIPWQRLCLGNAINPRTVWTDVSQREHRSGFVQSHWCFQGGNSNGSYHSSLLDLSFCFLCILTNAFVSDSQSILVEAFDY